MIFSKKYFISGVLIGIILLFAYLFSLPDGKLHIVFCDVGQGDAAYIRTPGNMDMLIDGGPDDRVLTCLGKHMPFYDRTIDMVVLTHPQKDHLQGLISVVDRYTVKHFVIGMEGNDTSGYKSLIENIKRKNVPVKNLFAGDKFSMGNVEFDVLWPEKKWVASHTSDLPTGDAMKGQVAIKTPRGWQADPPAGGEAMTPSMVKESEGAVLGLSTDTQLNDFSYFLDLKYGSFSALFPGDGDVHIQPEIMALETVPQVTVLKYPHHGSKTAMLPQFLDKLKPSLAVISVGRNSYGHPTQEALQMLENRGINIERTDQKGDIEIISDGINWKIN